MCRTGVYNVLNIMNTIQNLPLSRLAHLPLLQTLSSPLSSLPTPSLLCYFTALPTVSQTLPILEVEGKTLSDHVCISRYLAEKFGEYIAITTVQPLIKDTLNDTIEKTSLQLTHFEVPNVHFPIHLTSGNAWSQHVHYSAVPLY